MQLEVKYAIEGLIMLLRRITKHVKDQNWFAVFIDFVIVVVGVFIGIQVANWNEFRKNKAEEKLILENISIETDELLKQQVDAIKSYEQRFGFIKSAHRKLFALDNSLLTEDECNTIVSSHYYPRPIDEIGTLDSLASSGRMGLVMDPNIVKALNDYLQHREQLRGRYALVNNELFRLANRHSELFEFPYFRKEKDDHTKAGRLAEDGYKFDIKCDLKGMQNSSSFTNDYLDNTSRIKAMLEMYIEREVQVTKLKNTLLLYMGAQEGNK